MYHFAFVVEQVLGHITHGANLRRHVADDPDIDASWISPAFEIDGWAGRIPVYRSNWTVRAGWQARRELRRLRRGRDVDAVFFHTHVPAMLSPDLIRRVPTVISLDATSAQYDELGEYYDHRRGPASLERIKHRLATRTFEDARHIVTWSAWAKQGLVDGHGIASDKITVIPPGVSMAEWARPVDAPRGDPDAPTRVLFVGGDLDRKGGRLLLDACRRVGAEHAVELHMVTTSPLEPEPGVVVHRGVTPNSAELKELYRTCDLFALPTLGDCLPMVLSEAGAASLPSISTSVAAIPEVVLDGRTGLVVPPGDVEALEAALRRLVEHPEERRAMGARARDHVAEAFDTAANTRQLLEIMKSVAGEPGGAQA